MRLVYIKINALELFYLNTPQSGRNGLNDTLTFMNGNNFELSVSHLQIHLEFYFFTILIFTIFLGKK